jgi:hypothetical protein
MNKLAVRKRVWFDEGAEAFRAFVRKYGDEDQLPAAELYPCPLCSTLVECGAVESGLLTAEDVPPASIGGRPLVLTCKPCNDRSGHEIDVHVDNARKVIDFLNMRETGDEFPVVIDADGVPMRGGVKIQDGGIFAYGVDAQNDPRVKQRHLEILDYLVDAEVADPPVSITPRFPQINTILANLSIIRAAFLAAFAVFGWEYALRAVFDPLRAQIQNPTIKDLVKVLVQREPNEDRARRVMLLVSEPVELACIAVAIGETTVLLPHPYAMVTFAELAEAFESRRGEVLERGRLNGKLIPWPRKAVYGQLDLSPRNEDVEPE